MRKRLFKNMLKSIVKQEGKNLRYDSDPYPFHSNVVWILDYKKKKYEIIVFIDGVIDEKYQDFDYIDSILLGGKEVFDFEYIYKYKLDPFSYILGWVEDKKIEEYFLKAYQKELPT